MSTAPGTPRADGRPEASGKVELIHKSYPVLCTQLVDKAVDWLGRTRGENVGNAETPAVHAQKAIARPRVRHTGCAQKNATDLTKRPYPQFPRPLLLRRSSNLRKVKNK
jgi:hypothetical protein